MAFSWIFAIIAGIVILLLAIYAASKIIEMSKYGQYTETAKSISILIDPFETGVGSRVGDVIEFKQETRTRYTCYTPNSQNSFGKQTIAFSEKSGFGKTWGDFGGEISIRNKFIFSDELEEGKRLFVFAMPFYMGFKVSDLIFISTEDYCFIAAPNSIKEELDRATVANINFSDSLSQCSEKSIKVCFNTEINGCNISVYGDDEEFKTGYVKKDGDEINYAKNLIYGAIFSSAKIYECNVQRIGAKTSELANVYLGKASIIANKDCGSSLNSYLDLLIAGLKTIENSKNFVGLYPLAQEMDIANKEATCRLYFGEDY